MLQPDALKSEDYQHWSQGRGIDVWNMICASIAGDLPAIEQLVARDARLVNCSYEYFTPLHFAVREHQRAVIDYLLAQGADIVTTGGDSLLTMTRERGYDDLTTIFETIYRDRYHIVPEGDLIAAAIKAFDVPRVKALLQQQPALLHAADKEGNQPIHWAVLTRQLSLIDHLLTQGADINAMRPDGARPLDLTNGDYAYRSWYRDLPATGLRKHEVLIGYLIGRGADYDISVAAKVGDYDRVRSLLDQDAGLANRLPAYVGYYSGLPLRCAAAAGHIETVKLLLERGANPNEPEGNIAPWGGALHAAIGAKHYDIVKLLLEHGADANSEVESSGSCLFMAQYVGAPQEMVDLIASYARKGRPDKEPDKDTIKKPDEITEAQLHQLMDPTAWWDGATMSSVEFARQLFEKGLNPQRRNWLGITLLHRCAAKGDIDIARVCVEFGCNINALETEWSSTPLGWAVRAGQQAMVQWLLQQGADPTLPTDGSWAHPIAWARRRGYPEIEAILKAH